MQGRTEEGVSPSPSAGDVGSLGGDAVQKVGGLFWEVRPLLRAWGCRREILVQLGARRRLNRMAGEGDAAAATTAMEGTTGTRWCVVGGQVIAVRGTPLPQSNSLAVRIKVGLLVEGWLREGYHGRERVLRPVRQGRYALRHGERPFLPHCVEGGLQENQKTAGACP